MQDYAAINREQVHSETHPFTEERYRLFHRFMSRNAGRVLDFGCNTGRGGKVLKSLNPALQLSGLDIVRERLDRLPADVDGNNIHGTSTAMAADDNSFDAVVAGEFIEHLYPANVDKTLHEVFRVLRIGGTACCLHAQTRRYQAALTPGKRAGRGPCLPASPRYAAHQVADDRLRQGLHFAKRQSDTLSGMPFSAAGHLRQLSRRRPQGLAD